MNNNYKVSNVPMILGIIGGILGLPAAICSGACAAGISSLGEHATEASAADTGSTFLWIGIISALLGLIAAFMYKRNTKLWGILMIVAGVLSLVTLVTFNILSLIVAILFLIGGIIALNQKKPVVI